KALREKAARYDELEESQKSETQRLQEQLAALQKEAAESALRAERADVAAEKGVPAALLTGTTREELEAAADALLAFKGNQPKAPSPDGQGKVGDPIGGPKQITSRDQLKNMSAQEIEEARKNGQLD